MVENKTIYIEREREKKRKERKGWKEKFLSVKEKGSKSELLSSAGLL